MSLFWKQKHYYILLFLFLIIVPLAKGQQSLSIGDTQLKSNAVLYLKGNGSQGLIIPVVSSTGGFGEAGMIVYNSSDKNVYYHNGSSWTVIGGGGSSSGSYTLTLTGNNLLLKDGSNTISTVPLAASPATNQLLMWDGTKWAATTLSQDVSNANGVISVSGIKGKTIPTLPTSGTIQELIYDVSSASWKFQPLSSGGSVTSVATGTGLTGGPITTSGTLSVDVGTTANKIVQLDNAGKLPAINGSQLTSLPDPSSTNEIQNLSTAGTGTATTGESFDLAISLGTGIKIKEGTNVQIDQAANVLTINSVAGGTGTVTNIATGTGLTGGPITSTGTLAVDVGTTANKIVQLDGTGKLPALNGSQLTSLPDPSSTNEIQNLSTAGTGTATTGESFDVAISSGTGIKIKEGTNVQIDQAANVLTINSVAGGSGTVTSVDLSMPSMFLVTGSPITTSGAFTTTLVSQAANTFLGAPSGATGIPSFRTFVAADIPALPATKITSGTLPLTRGGTGLGTTPTNGQLLIGNGTDYTLSTLTGGTGVTITNGAGTITVNSTGLTNPMTTAGDLIVGGASGSPTRLAGTTGFLKSTGATAPSWSSINLASADVAGTLGVTNGGTGKTTWDGLVFGSGTTLSDISTGTSGQILRVAGTTPTWSNFAVTSTDITDLTIVDADVSATAAIAGTKIIPAFGSQNISTTGTGSISGGLTSGNASQFSINATGNIISINNVATSFPSLQGTANTVLTNDGTGSLTWATYSGSSLISNAGTKNLFAGVNAGLVNSGSNNTFIGFATGKANTSAINNTFVGAEAGLSNTTGAENTFLGRLAGTLNKTGSYNVYVGKDAGNNMVTGDLNTFVGYQAGHSADGTDANTFLGRLAGGGTTTGGLNTFLGEQSGLNNKTGTSNVFVGRNTGLANLGGGTITLLGSGANVGNDNLANATAIGANAVVGASNTMVLGAANTKVGIGITPNGELQLSTTTSNRKLVLYDASNNDYQFYGFGVQSGQLRYQVANNTGASHIFYSAVSAGSSLELMRIQGNTGFVGINTSSPSAYLSVNGDADKVGGGSWATFSDRRVKKDIRSFNDGLNILLKINPMQFKYNGKAGYTDDGKDYVGIIAQDVLPVAPYMISSVKKKLNESDAEETDVLKYDGSALTYVLVNSIKEQQTEIEKLKEVIQALETKLKLYQDKESNELIAINAQIQKINEALGLEAKAQKK